MSLATGTRLGPYEVTGPLGAGGMGEVYRARDTKLGREVAIKILPAALAADRERLARFEREAQSLAALNHPNIAQVYAFESVATEAAPDAAPFHALVMELVEGPTLADRLAQGPLPLAEALPLARQLAEALEVAHEQGIVHRDLKPANIKVRHDGTVKVLDFGLAKAMEKASGAGLQASGAEVADSPAITSPAAMTRAGVVLGTAAYMSPEQARGKPVDRRTDIWAFGAVLYEMLTGRRAFDGETVPDAVAAVLQTGTDLTRLPPGTPAPVRTLIERTLRKDARQRLRDIGDARLVLDEVIAGAPGVEALAPPESRAHRRWTVAMPWTLAALLAIVATLAGMRALRPAPTALPVVRYSIGIPDLSQDYYQIPVLSPDGRRLAYVSKGELWVRDLDQLEPRLVAGVNDPKHPFWSPDSRQIGFFDQAALWRVTLDGGPPVLVARARMNRGARTPTAVWRPDGQIVFAPSATGSGLLSVPSTGGEFATFYERREGEGDLHRPSLLPDGTTMIFVVDRTAAAPDTIGVLAGNTRKDLLTLKGERLDGPVYSPTGHILYQRETGAPGVWALPFSLDRLEATGQPFLVAPGGTWPAVTSNGTLIYADSRLTGQVQLVWFDLARGSVEAAFPGTFPALANPALSPDGKRVVVMTRGAGAIDNNEVVLLDLERQTHSQLARNASSGFARPRWRGVDAVVYTREDAAGAEQVVSIRADGSGGERVIGPGGTPDVSRDGKHVVFVEINAGTSGDLWHVEMDDVVAKPTLLQRNAYNEDYPALSPDARLLAYSANETGQWEVYLRPFPTGAGRWLVSSDGGMRPLWSPTGNALYYRSLQGVPIVVDVKTDAAGMPRLGAPRPIRLPGGSAPLATGVRTVFGFDVSTDGKRLLIVQNAEGDRPRDPTLVVIQNWLATTASSPAADNDPGR